MNDELKAPAVAGAVAHERDYPPLPAVPFCRVSHVQCADGTHRGQDPDSFLYTADQMRTYVDEDRASRTDGNYNAMAARMIGCYDDLVNGARVVLYFSDFAEAKKCSDALKAAQPHQPAEEEVGAPPDVTDAERMAFLHSTNSDAEGYEYGVCKVKFGADGTVSECLWTASDHSDIDALILSQRTPTHQG